MVMRIVRHLLFPISLIYGLLVVLRNVCYDIGLFRTYRLRVPVISVGNLTIGGTGKTSLVEYIARYLIGKGKKVAIISRGYKRTSKGAVVVSDGQSVLVLVFESGDEPQQLARSLPQAIVIVCERRVEGANIAVKRFGAEVIVLDDGFQHRSLERDLDIVVVDAKHLPTATALLPAGRRREPLFALRRADMILVSKCDDQRLFETAAHRLHRYRSMPMVASRHKALYFQHISGEEQRSVESFQGTRAVAFCGIADPMSFFETLAAVGVTVRQRFAFHDHHYYRTTDIQEIITSFKTERCDYIMTTAKDVVRLFGEHRDLFKGYPVFVLVIGIGMLSGETAFLHQIDLNVH
jgi:tetraacyldisaccharide 4'-kinase